MPYVREVLADGERPYEEVLAYLMTRVDPGVAYRRAEKQRLRMSGQWKGSLTTINGRQKPRTRDKDVLTIQMAGARRVAIERIWSAVKSGVIHERHVGERRMLSLARAQPAQRTVTLSVKRQRAERAKAIVALREQGLLFREIGDRVGLSRNHAAKIYRDTVARAAMME